MDELLRCITHQYGVFLTREALELGMDDRTFRRLYRAGHFHRVRHGAYTFPDVWAGLDDRDRHRLESRAVFRRAQTPVAISHASAIVEHTRGAWDLDLSEVHVTRLDGRAGRREAGVRQHQGLLLPGDLETIGEFTVTSATKSALDLTTTTSLDRSLVVFDKLLHDGQTSKPLLEERYRAGMTQCPYTLTTELTIALSDGRAESAGESLLKHLCWVTGLPMPDLQHTVVSADGVILGITDFWWREYDVFGEFDGKVKYSRLLRPGETPADAVVREKRREEAIAEETGCRFIRFIWEDLFHREATRQRIAHVLRAPKFRRYFT